MNAMNQQALALEMPTADAADAADGVGRAGFELGWDHARHGLVPPAGLLQGGTPVSQGWKARRCSYRGRVRCPAASVRPCRTYTGSSWFPE